MAPKCITRGVDQVLMRLCTDVLDVVHFHSCALEVLQRPGLVEALVRAVEERKVCAAAYSGDNAAMEYAAGHMTSASTGTGCGPWRSTRRAGLERGRTSALGLRGGHPRRVPPVWCGLGWDDSSLHVSDASAEGLLGAAIHVFRRARPS